MVTTVCHSLFTEYGNAGLALPVVDGLSFVKPQITLYEVNLVDAMVMFILKVFFLYCRVMQ